MPTSSGCAIGRWNNEICDGSGYWQYIPTDNGVRFLTWYDYHTRFGRTGAACDRLLFRPLLGWATAWSFDRLRLWLEDQVVPSQALRDAAVHAIARLTLAIIVAYHGLVPKLLAGDPDEIAMVRDAGVPSGAIGGVVSALGIAELLLAACLLICWLRRWPLGAVTLLIVTATAGVVWTSPQYLTAAFNPVSLNLAVLALAAIDLLVISGVPSAARCRRRPRSEPA